VQFKDLQEGITLNEEVDEVTASRAGGCDAPTKAPACLHVKTPSSKRYLLPARSLMIQDGEDVARRRAARFQESTRTKTLRVCRAW